MKTQIKITRVAQVAYKIGDFFVTNQLVFTGVDLTEKIYFGWTVGQHDMLQRVRWLEINKSSQYSFLSGRLALSASRENSLPWEGNVWPEVGQVCEADSSWPVRENAIPVGDFSALLTGSSLSPAMPERAIELLRRVNETKVAKEKLDYLHRGVGTPTEDRIWLDIESFVEGL